MLNYDEFPYQKYFYDSEQALRNFHTLVCENSKGYDNNLEDSLDQTSEAYFVNFTWDVVDAYKSIKKDNRDFFFKHLIKYINKVNTIYKNIDIVDEFSKKLVLKLIDENYRKLQFIQEESFDDTPILNLEKWNEKSTYPFIFRNKNAETIFFAVVEEITAIKENGKIMNAKANAIYTNKDMKNNVFISGLKLKNYVEFLNSKYPASIGNDTRLSDPYAYSEDVSLAFNKFSPNKSE